MAYDGRDNIDFGKENIPTLFNRIFIPTLLGMVFNLAFILTDGIFVGHGVGPDGLAAVNIVGPVMMLMTGLGMMFGTGSSVVAAILHLLGTSDELMPETLEYLLWFIPTCILILIQIVGEFVIRLDGSPKYAMTANIIPAVILHLSHHPRPDTI